MAAILGFAAASLGGWLGWMIGERFGFMTACFTSLVGTAAGVWAANEFRRRWLP